MTRAPEFTWLEYCPSCKRRHRVSWQRCPVCNAAYDVPQPISNNVANKCHADYACDGCMAYRDHER